MNKIQTNERLMYFVLSLVAWQWILTCYFLKMKKGFHEFICTMYTCIIIIYKPALGYQTPTIGLRLVTTSLVAINITVLYPENNCLACHYSQSNTKFVRSPLSIITYYQKFVIRRYQFAETNNYAIYTWMKRAPFTCAHACGYF